MEGKLTDNFWTLPNVISLVRLIFGAPVTIWLYAQGFEWAWFIFLLFVLTDWLDGFIARRQKSESSWGMILDPVADQFLVLPIIWMFYFAGVINVFLPIFLTSREILMALIRVFAKRDIPANMLGKAKVVAEYIGIGLLLVGGELYILGLLIFFPIIILAAISLFKYAYDVFFSKLREGAPC